MTEQGGCYRHCEWETNSWDVGICLGSQHSLAWGAGVPRLAHLLHCTDCGDFCSNSSSFKAQAFKTSLTLSREVQTIRGTRMLLQRTEFSRHGQSVPHLCYLFLLQLFWELFHLSYNWVILSSRRRETLIKLLCQMILVWFSTSKFS